MNTSWHSYPSVFALGHKAISELFIEPVLVEEKIDGSQFSFGRFDDGINRSVLKCRSKGATLNVDYPEKMFTQAVAVAADLGVHKDWTYRAEYLQKPKHNTLAYDRVPKNNLILFDINTGEEEYLSYEDKQREAERLGLEIVPLLFRGSISEPKTLLDFLELPSILGGQKIEGVVIKNYARFGQDKKVLMGKYVSEAFKEVHGAEWKKNNPTSGDIIQRLILQYKTPARWNKAVQHLRDRGELTQSPRDIGALIKEVQMDIDRECADEIKDALYAHAMQHIRRGITGGLPEWYKEELLKLQFQS